MAFSNFGEQFAAKTLRKFYTSAVTPAITNTNYEGEIRKAGDRVNILSFLSDIVLSDYTSHSDMDLESIVDSEDTLVVEKRKYYNFPIDRLEDLFTYAMDVDDTLVENAAKTLERTIDKYVLEKAGDVKAGNWVGIDLRVVGSGTTNGTMASLATSATGGTITLQANDTIGTGLAQAAMEHPQTGVSVFTGMTSADVGRPIRLTSGTAYATEWYKISGVTDSNTCTVVNWDGATSGSDIPTGDVLRGIRGGSEYVSQALPLETDIGYPLTGATASGAAGWGWQIQGAFGTTTTGSNVFDTVTDLAEKLNNNEIPDTDRHITVTPRIFKFMQQASELQPSGIEALYTSNIVNGKVARVGGFDVHMASNFRVSSRADHASASGTYATTTVSTGGDSEQVLANHRSFCTFAYKWAESRVVDAEDRFSKKYQGLHLFGALVPALRRRAGALLITAKASN